MSNYGPYSSIHTYNTNVFITGKNDALAVTQWKEKLQSIIAQIPDTDLDISPVIQLLVASLAPARIYRLQQHTVDKNEKYIDLLIIMPPNNRPFVEMEPVILLPFTTDYHIHCSLHCHSNVLQGLRNGHLFYSLVIRPENLVYDNNSIEPLPQITDETNERIVNNIKTQWTPAFQKAQQFFAAASNVDDQTPALKVFLLHQATELTFRAIIKNLIGFEKKSHEIRVLRKYAARIAPALSAIFSEDTDENKRLLHLFDNAYMNARYDAGFAISDEDLTALKNRVTELLSKSEQVVSSYLPIHRDV